MFPVLPIGCLAPLRRRLAAGCLALAFVLAGFAGGEVRAGDFVPGIEDLPLMAELEPIDGSGFAFDTASGRLVEAYASGTVAPEAVLAFYERTLPALGWEAGDDQTWQREGETLAIEFVEGAEPLTVRFQLAPQE
ncbi:MAG: hypothetical protein SGJ07_03170 [Rhodospirillaceae bacterium]|nr:hypothetical protein [Rhodospirillaceae bacterium]